MPKTKTIAEIPLPADTQDARAVRPKRKTTPIHRPRKRFRARRNKGGRLMQRAEAINKDRAIGEICVQYDGGLDTMRDHLIHHVAGKIGDSGCCLFPPYARDHMFEVFSELEARNMIRRFDEYLNNVTASFHRFANEDDDDAPTVRRKAAFPAKIIKAVKNRKAVNNG